MGAARQPDQVRGSYRHLRAGDRSLPPPTGAATADRHRRRATTYPSCHRRRASRSRRRRPATWVLCRRAGLCQCSTGGPTMASLASAPAVPSRTWRPTTGRRRRCAARRTCPSTPPPTVTAPAGCCSRQPRRRVRLGPFDPGPPDPEFEFGRWLVTIPARGREVNGHLGRPGRSMDIRIKCSAVSHFAVYIYGSNHEQRQETFHIAWILPLCPTVTPLQRPGTRRRRLVICFSSVLVSTP